MNGCGETVASTFLTIFLQLFVAPTTFGVKIFFYRHYSYFLYIAITSCFVSVLLFVAVVVLLLLLVYAVVAYSYVFLTNFSGFLSVSEPDRTIATLPRHAHYCFFDLVRDDAQARRGCDGGNRCCNSACFLATCVDAL